MYILRTSLLNFVASIMFIVKPEREGNPGIYETFDFSDEVLIKIFTIGSQK